MKRTWILVAFVMASVLLLIWSSVSFALLLSSAEPVVNLFRAPVCELDVEEEFDGVTKENVRVQVHGDVTQYVRVQLLFSLQDAEGNTLVEPISRDDFIIEGFDANAWVAQDGYYYYKQPVAPEEEILICTSARVKTSFPADKIPVMMIAAQGVQTSAAQREWGVHVVGGEIA